MSKLEELTSKEGLYDVEGGVAIEIAGFVLAALAFGFQWYETAKSDAAQAGVRDAYNDMHFPK